jgi:LysM repeat protein
MSKTEKEIEKEKDAVAKMVGAKSAMQSMIERHDRLVNALKEANMLVSDLGKHVGEDLYIKTYYHGERGKDGPEYVQVRKQMQRISDRVRELTA